MITITNEFCVIIFSDNDALKCDHNKRLIIINLVTFSDFHMMLMHAFTTLDCDSTVITYST